jgi:hypothetical protein
VILLTPSAKLANKTTAKTPFNSQKGIAISSLTA